MNSKEKEWRKNLQIIRNMKYIMILRLGKAKLQCQRMHICVLKPGIYKEVITKIAKRVDTLEENKLAVNENRHTKDVHI